MEYAIVRVNRDNYWMLDDLVFYRINGRGKNASERAETPNFDAAYESLENENLSVFAAWLDDKLIGWISVVYIPKVGRTMGRGHLFIDELYVMPAYRKQGVAKALMEKAEQLSQDIGALGLRLYVNRANAAANALYKKCGYQTRGEALFMEKVRRGQCP